MQIKRLGLTCGLEAEMYVNINSRVGAKAPVHFYDFQMFIFSVLSVFILVAAVSYAFLLHWNVFFSVFFLFSFL